MSALLNGNVSIQVTDESRRRWHFSGPDEIAKALKDHLDQEGLGRDRLMGAAMTMGKVRLGDAGEVLATRKIPGGALEVGVIDASGLEAGWREQLRWVVMMITLAVLAVGAGLWVMMLGVFKERKMAYAKSQFVASVTHELRAPVGSIRLMADALESGKVRPQKVGEFHRLMARESGRLSVLIENVMDLAKVEDGRRVIRLEEVELSGLVAEVCEMMAMQAEETGVRFEFSDEELLVTADPVALRQILVNLIDNAVKFSPKGGVVKIGWEEGWSLTVSDEGPGVPEGEREKIFERFYRGEDELRRTTKGVGIGLSLVRELVELQGGRVCVANEGGSVFEIEFKKS
ncbi:HAMP domain-containing sensor histidine kinase [Verrucomicrobiaceae bacterium 227]